MTTKFELRFEGPSDDSAPTLRRIKGVFVADLEFPASDVQRFLKNAPIIIKAADSENELKKSYDLLTNAGAKVLIVRPALSESINFENSAPTVEVEVETELELPALVLEFDSVLSTKPTETVPTETEEINSLDLSFDFASDPKIREIKDVKDTATDKNIPQEDQDFSNSLSFDLSFNEPKEIATTDLPSSTPSFDLGLSLDETAQPETPIDKSNSLQPSVVEPYSSNNTSSSDLELEVITPANSTLFGQLESQSEGNEEVATQALVTEETAPETIVETLTEATPTPLATKPQLSVEQEDPIELTLAELEELQRLPVAPFKLPLTPLLIFICLGLMFLVNQWFFMPKGHTNPFTEMIDQLPKLIPQPNSAEQAQLLAEKAAELAQSAWYSSEQNFSNRTVKATVWVEKSVPIHGSIAITTPEPPALSKEEIVNAVPLRPWLRRLELKDLVFKLENSSLLASGPALAYFSIGDKNIRSAGTATLKASLDETNKTLTLEARASHKLNPSNAPPTPEQPILSFQLAEPGGESTPTFEFFERIELKRP